MAEKLLKAITIAKAGDGKLFDGGGLTLVKSGETGKWVYRYSRLGKRREMGIGPWPAISLADARRSRDGWATVLAAGQDPIEVRRAQQADEIAARDKDDPTFADAVTLVFEAIRDGLRGGGTRGRWRSPLDTHIIPKIGHRRLSELHAIDIKTALAPIWRKKHPTAEKCVNRISIVIRKARRMGFDCDPFIVESAREMLGEVRHVVEPIPSTPWQEIPALFARLDNGGSVDQCLRWMILSIARMDACAGARFAEIEGDVWTVPADRIKGKEGAAKDFRVPLSTAALEIVEYQRTTSDGLLFPSYTGRPITSTALEKRLKLLGEVGRPHGFRSSFRTWVQDTEACAWEVSEVALGHVIGTTVERAYARSDLLNRRRIVMQAWADHVTEATSATVSRIRG